MRALLGIPNGDRLEEVTALWRDLEGIATPFPFEYDKLDVQWEHTGCDMEPQGVAVATAKLCRRTNTARICLAEAFFQEPRDVQLGILLHEAVHIRLFLGRLQRTFLVSEAFDERARTRSSTSNPNVYRFAVVSNEVAKSLLHLVAEIGVDKFTASPQYAVLSTLYWRKRCQNFYIDGARSVVETVTPWLIDPPNFPVSLQPYVEFYRLVALDLGLRVIKDLADLQALCSRRDAYVAALDTTCDEEMASWLKGWQTKLIAFDPSPADPDTEAYDELCERVLALTA